MVRLILPLVLLAFGLNAPAQEFPTKPVRIVVGVGPGSVADVRSRWLAQHLSATLGQPVIVENRVGAGGSIAAEHVARSAPDGHTLLFATVGTLVMPDIYPSAGFDPLRDFVPAAALSRGYAVLTVRANLPVQSVADLLRLAREKPGKLNYGSTGIGGPPWLAAELFRRVANIDVTHVPYKGGGELLTDLMAGNLDYWFESATIQLPHIQAGRIRALAVTGPHRMPALPDVPTLREAGLDGFDLKTWTALLAPAGTPRAAIARVNAEVSKIMSSPEAKALLAEQSSERIADSPEEFAAFMKQERARWSPIVREASVKSQL